MGVLNQEITDRHAVYNGDCLEVLPSYPDGSIHCSLYSPPFAGLFHYTSSERDLSNARSYPEFLEHYGFVVAQLARITMPGRWTLVHCTDIPNSNTGRGDSLTDFPGDIIRLHEQHGFTYAARYHVWKEPLTVRNRTMAKGLAHRTIVEDSSRCSVANADYLLGFRRKGENPVPIEHPVGLLEYAGERTPPAEVLRYRGWTGKQTENRFSHWVWRQYASAFWDDVRLDRVLPFREARDDEDEKHVHPLQLDVIDRGLELFSNPGERVLTPFMGVGSEVHEAVLMGRQAVGIELKPSYYRQALRNLAAAAEQRENPADQPEPLFDLTTEETPA
ncbi:DNA-methyltransferase [Actinomycetospora aeridis]|uniref:Methyltransferase n=1 Tax=Actinomycetospora aeridis TaxID=3129231 RepID=A0ABU8N169_9PSEU